MQGKLLMSVLWEGSGALSFTLACSLANQAAGWAKGSCCLSRLNLNLLVWGWGGGCPQGGATNIESLDRLLFGQTGS